MQLSISWYNTPIEEKNNKFHNIVYKQGHKTQKNARCGDNLRNLSSLHFSELFHLQLFHKVRI